MILPHQKPRRRPPPPTKRKHLPCPVPAPRCGDVYKRQEVDLKVANLIVPQLPNGACLQLGLGGMPNAIGGLIAQSDLKDLGVHTEMYVDAFVDLSLIHI